MPTGGRGRVGVGDCPPVRLFGSSGWGFGPPLPADAGCTRPHSPCVTICLWLPSGLDEGVECASAEISCGLFFRRVFGCIVCILCGHYLACLVRLWTIR